MLVEFFAPWSGHCKALAPEYEEAATTLKNGSGIKLAKVDCTEHADLCQANGVGDYPTLKVFRNGKDKELYGGPRKADGIVRYMNKQALPVVSAITNDKHTTFIKDNKVVVVAYVHKESDALLKTVQGAAENHRDEYLFGSTTDAEAIKAAGVTPPALVVYKPFDEGRVDLPAAEVKSASAKSLAAFIKENTVPLLDEISGENYATYAQSGLPLAYLFLDPTLASKDSTIAEITPVAKKFKGKVNFVWIDAIKHAEHAKSLKLLEAKWPAFAVDDMPHESFKYPLDQLSDPTASSVAAHVSDFVAGKLTPKLTSDPVPETQEEASYTLVGSQFEEVVFDDAKDVFAEFYAPWCGQCKRLTPVWGELAKLYSSQKDKLTVQVLKMDATTNDLPPSAGFKISVLPTLKFKPA
ncbi:protein disulfide-isomerase precursor, partial [Ceratobasidium sp. 392]